MELRTHFMGSHGTPYHSRESRGVPVGCQEEMLGNIGELREMGQSTACVAHAYTLPHVGEIILTDFESGSRRARRSACGPPPGGLEQSSPGEASALLPRSVVRDGPGQPSSVCSIQV